MIIARQLSTSDHMHLILKAPATLFFDKLLHSQLYSRESSTESPMVYTILSNGSNTETGLQELVQNAEIVLYLVFVTCIGYLV